MMKYSRTEGMLLDRPMLHIYLIYFGIGDKSVVHALVSALKDKDWRVRAAAARALGKTGSLPRKAVLQLRKLRRNDEKTAVRVWAAYALYTLRKEKRFFSFILEAIRSKDGCVREASVKVLGELRDKRALVLLIDALGDKVASVSAAAARVLGKLGDKHAVSPLINTLKSRW